MGLGLGLLLGLGRGLPSAVDTYRKGQAFNAAQEEARLDREMRMAQLDEQRQQREQAFQLDQRRLNASVTEEGNKQRQQEALRAARGAALQGIATTDRGELGDMLRGMATAGGGRQVFRDMDPDEITRLATLTSRETPEERAEREMQNIIEREKAQQRYSERLVAAASGAAANRQTPDQIVAREEVRHAQTNVRGADRDFRRVMGRKPVVSESRFRDQYGTEPNQQAFQSALAAWHADSADADNTRQDARDDLTSAEQLRDKLFPGLGRVPQPTPQPTPREPVTNPAAQAEFKSAADRFKRLIDAGADPAEVRAAYEATVQQIARRYGMMQ